MNISNQKLYEAHMPQVIIEDSCQLPWTNKVEEMNAATLSSMYRVQDSIYNLFGRCDMQEIEANTISPAQQNIFIPLKSWRINLGGAFAIVSIHQRFLDGCFAEMETI